MATNPPLPLEAAFAQLRAARARLFVASQQRMRAVERRVRRIEPMERLNDRIANARAEVIEATETVRLLMLEE